jgi:hypothetical protein
MDEFWLDDLHPGLLSHHLVWLTGCLVLGSALGSASIVFFVFVFAFAFSTGILGVAPVYSHLA